MYLVIFLSYKAVEVQWTPQAESDALSVQGFLRKY
jgi:uncharacterized membrane protein